MTQVQSVPHANQRKNKHTNRKPKIIKILHSVYPEYMGFTKLRRDTYSFLNKIKDRKKLAVVTNTPTKLTKKILRQLGVDKFFRLSIDVQVSIEKCVFSIVSLFRG